jgi:hypothetical protein
LCPPYKKIIHASKKPQPVIFGRPVSSVGPQKERPVNLAAACATTPAMAVTFRRWWAETLQAIEGKPTDVRTLMFKRTATLYGLQIDRWRR